MLVHRVPAYTDNYLWIIEGQNQQCLLVDPGDHHPIVEHLKSHELSPVAILLTHHHWDHVDGVSPLKHIYPDLDVYGVNTDRVPCLSRSVKPGDLINIDGFEQIEVFDFAGHTRDQIGFKIGKHLFSGDTLFAGGCGRLFEGTAAQMQSSLSKIRSMAPETLIHCAHEYTEANMDFCLSIDPNNPQLITRAEDVKAQRKQQIPTVPFTLESDISTNVFMRWDDPVIIQHALENGAQDGTPAEIFGAIRRLKDKF